ncbi:hypothetical protein V5799_033464 [Amblyomma americanum]|uniref:Uncharacterized protein n=1 Tax=Amblyomma americanum TaxID=6943 RepID=A0AAQ4DN81_AMBAM
MLITGLIFVQDCSGAECISFTCQMGPFAQKNKVAKIEVSMIVNVTRIMEQVGTPDTVDIISEGSLSILDDTEFTHYVKQQPKEAMIVTSLVKEGPPAPYSLPCVASSGERKRRTWSVPSENPSQPAVRQIHRRQRPCQASQQMILKFEQACSMQTVTLETSPTSRLQS